ncbi:MAG: cobalamin-dependent protein [Candidatus Omnitrophica bacterium]|nr:cobalamin-dependent protein [Candidatus Omnitrophota bacterium]
MINRVTLVNPYFQKKTQAIAQITVGPPLGLAYIASALESKGYTVNIIDANAERLSIEDTVFRLLESKPDLAGFSAVTPTIGICRQLAEMVKKENNSIVTVVGGIHPTSLAEETLRNCAGFDFLIRGEGELALAQLISALNDHVSLDNIKGLGYRKSDQVFVNGTADSVKNLDDLGFPARHLLKNSLYRTFDSGKMTSVIAMRGCPEKCIYCAVSLVAGRICRKRNHSNIIEEIETCFHKYKTNFVAFLDDTFTFDRPWVHRLCDGFIASGLNRKIKWSCLTRVDNIDPDLLRHMKQAGCIRVELGIESGSQKILDYTKKGISIQQAKEAFLMAKKAGLSTMGFAMLNIPGETRDTISATKKLIMELEPDFLQVSFATPYPGTELFEICRKENLLTTREWSKYLFLNNQIIKNPAISENELKDLMRDIQQSFHLRPKYIFKMFLYMLKNPASIRTMLWAGANAFKKLL